jgi:hypothetical protein
MCLPKAEMPELVKLSYRIPAFSYRMQVITVRHKKKHKTLRNMTFTCTYFPSLASYNLQFTFNTRNSWTRCSMKLQPQECWHLRRKFMRFCRLRTFQNEQHMARLWYFNTIHRIWRKTGLRYHIPVHIRVCVCEWIMHSSWSNWSSFTEHRMDIMALKAMQHPHFLSPFPTMISRRSSGGYGRNGSS